jgi:two-component system chemotaxis response regulator CheY
MKYLVVDDSATMRRIVVNSLQRIGVTDIVEAGDGKEALDKFDASNGAIGFIITDWNMPNMGGIDLAKAIRSRPGGKALPILMVTARSVREDIITALESEVNYYIVKPFTPAVLKEKIDALLSPAPSVAS